jgi:hypothetical protein
MRHPVQDVGTSRPLRRFERRAGRRWTRDVLARFGHHFLPLIQSFQRLAAPCQPLCFVSIFQMVKLQAETVAGSRRNAVATFVLRASARVGTAGGHSPVDFASSKAGAGVLIQTVGNSRRGIRRHRTVAGMIEPPLPPLKAFAFGDLEAAFSTRRSIACGVRRTRPACLLDSNSRPLPSEGSAPMRVP